MDDVTVVTALYDLGRGDLESFFKRPFEKYLEWFEELLKVALPMIVFTDNTEVEKMATKYNKMVVWETIEDIRDRSPYFRHIETIRQNPAWFGAVPWLRESPQAALRYYNLLVMNKMDMLVRAIFLSQTDYYLWLDAGTANTTDMSLFSYPFKERVIPYLDDMLFMAFPYRQEEIHGFPIDKMDQFSGQKVDRVVRATMFGGRADAIMAEWFLYDSLLQDTLKQGFMGTEENILTIMSYLNSNNYKLYTLDDVPRISKFLEEIRR